ncbi:MAG TPA: hypothetical protein VLM85_34465 [Polyangiaceae bacterium]|nr:hypothetical protein [Polyangiaceae bacterium]
MAGRQVFVIRDVKIADRWERKIEPAEAVPLKRHVTMVRYHDGTMERFTTSTGRARIWDTSEQANAALRWLVREGADALQSESEATEMDAETIDEDSGSPEAVATPAVEPSAPLGEVPHPGWFIKLVEAGAKAIGGPYPLQRIDLGVADETAIARSVRHHFDTGFGDLNVEGCVRWGALFLYAFARRQQGITWVNPLPAPLTKAQAQWLEQGRQFWDARLVAGASAAYVGVIQELGPFPDPEPQEPTYTLAAESMLPILRRHRVRVQLAPDDGGSEPRRKVWLSLRVPDRRDITVRIEDAPGTQFDGARVLVPLREEWTEIVFSLWKAKPGPAERVGLQIGHVGNRDCSVVLDEGFDVLASLTDRGTT